MPTAPLVQSLFFPRAEGICPAGSPTEIIFCPAERKEIKEIFVRLNDVEGVTLSVAAGRNDLRDNK